MAWRRLAGALTAPLTLAALACGGGPTAGTAPNVLLIVVDALRADVLGVNGYDLPTTPHLDRLAAQGVSLPRAHAHSTWTKPSIATLFTSLYPPQHGLEHVAEDREGVLSTEVLLEEVWTLAESFAAAGYHTGAVLDQVHLQERFGFSQGFTDYANLRGVDAPRLNHQLLRWLDERATTPFFAYLHYLDAHWPYTHVRPGDERGRFGRVRLSERPPNNARLASKWAAGRDPADIAALRARYDSEVAWTDHWIGELLRELDARALLADTLVVVTSDHGEAFMEHGRIQHGTEPYRELTHVPVILRPPEGWARFRVVEHVVGLIDLMPTVLDLLGLPVPESCQGRSFAPGLRGEPIPRRLHYSEGAGVVAVRSRERSLLLRPGGSFDVFDTRSDPFETSAVAWACEGPCARMLRGARTYRSRLERRVKRGGKVLEALTAEDLAELRALGYL